MVGLGCRFKVDPLTCIFLCWYSMWYWFPLPSCGRCFVATHLLKGDELLEHLALQIRTNSFLNYVCFFSFPWGGLLWNFLGIWWFFLQVAISLVHVDLPSGTLVRPYKGKEGELCYGNWWETHNRNYILNHGIKRIASVGFEVSRGAGKFVMFPCGITKCFCLINSFFVLFIFLIKLVVCQLLSYFRLLMF